MLTRIIPTKLHGIADYAGSALILAASTGLEGTPATVARSVGASALVSSLFTDYELGVVRLMPVRGHLALDGASGLELVASAAAPAGGGARGIISRVVPVLAGLGELALALLTQPEPPKRWRRKRSRFAFGS